MYRHEKRDEYCWRVLEENGGLIADKARKILLEDPALKDLRPPLEFISKNWRDLTPALGSLSCEAVGGCPEETYNAALALCLMHLSFNVWDDIVDNAQVKAFKPTLFGKFGANTALIVGGLASAKAFSVLNQMDMEEKKRKKIDKLIWGLWAIMARVEVATLKPEQVPSYREKFWKIKMEAADFETCLKIGALIGGGSESEIAHAGKYGRYLGIVLGLQKDFQVSVNFSGELAEKIRNGKLSYSILWARQYSKRIQKTLGDLLGKSVIEQTSIKEIVHDILEVGTLDHIAKKIAVYTGKTTEALLYLPKSRATQTLKSLVISQPRLFIESLSSSKM